MHTLLERRLVEIQRREEKRLGKIRTKAEKPANLIQRKLEEMEAKVPAGARNALEKGFAGGLRFLLGAGMGALDKAVRSEKERGLADKNRKMLAQMPSKAALRAVRGQASGIQLASLGITAAEGTVLGLLGVGLPDIPLFMSALLGSCFRIAQSYSYDYKRQDEQVLALLLIQGAVTGGEAYAHVNSAADRMLYAMSAGKPFCWDMQSAVQDTAAALASDLLLLKCVQGLPVVGVVGGVGNAVYCQKVLDYAALKYEKRFLLEQQRALL